MKDLRTRGQGCRPLAMSVVLPSLLALLAACQSSPRVPARTAGGELLCTRETPVGTNVPVTRCRTRAGAEQERVEARDTRADIGEKQDLVAQPIK